MNQKFVPTVTTTQDIPDERQDFLNTMADHYAARAVEQPDMQPFLKIRATELRQQAASGCIIHIALAPGAGEEING